MEPQKTPNSQHNPKKEQSQKQHAPGIKLYHKAIEIIRGTRFLTFLLSIVKARFSVSVGKYLVLSGSIFPVYWLHFVNLLIYLCFSFLCVMFSPALFTAGSVWELEDSVFILHVFPFLWLSLWMKTLFLKCTECT